MRILLADGHNLLFRSFYGIPARILGADGNSVHAVVGVIGSLLRTLRNEDATAILVAFDSESGSFRDRELSTYKANRIRDFSGVDPTANPFAQLAALKCALDTLGWKYCEIEGIEADDVIAEYSRLMSEEDHAIIISADKDLLQLVTPNVTLVGSGNRRYTPADVLESYGVYPAQLPFFRALTGDASDNLPGVRGIGPKNAMRLVQQFQSPDRMYADLLALPGRHSRALVEARETVYRVMQLATLNHPVRLPFTLADLRVRKVSPEVRTMTVLRDAGLLAQ
jgi:DNA polymerase-1